jgi:tRNA(Ile)-lysidine synthase
VGGPDPAVAAVRHAVRSALVGRTGPVLVACSGGHDSVALAAAVAFEAAKLPVSPGLVTVDHGLQAGSADQAQAVADLGKRLGFDPVRIMPVTVGTDGGPEAAARTVRYAALAAAAVDAGAAHVLLGHTLDDQAETVLLGLGRGSGPRSVAGMRPVDPPWLRPLLGIRRASTAAACVAEGLAGWDDPHNADPRYTRVRLRHEVLPLLEDALHGGVAEALARTAALVRADLDALDALAASTAAAVRGRCPDCGDDSLDAVTLAVQPAAIRTRVLRAWAAAPGATGGISRSTPLTSAHLTALDALLTGWHGQGPVGLPGGCGAIRRHGRLHLEGPAG